MEEASEPHEHDAAGWAKHRERQRQPYCQPDEAAQQQKTGVQRNQKC